MNGGSGQSSQESFAWYDPASSSWRMYQESLAPTMGEQWVRFLETWPRAGMMRNGIAYPLPALALRTSEKESSSWPTPDVRGFTNDGSLSMLAEKVKDYEEFSRMAYRKSDKMKRELWPTPRTDMTHDYSITPKGGHKPSIGKTRGHSLGTALAARMWPTPTSRDWKDTGDLSKVPENSLLPRVVQRVERMWPTPQAGANNPAAHNAMSGDFKERFCERAGIPITGQLNPMWVEWLMGFPLGWTVLDASETQWFLNVRNGLEGG